MEAVGVWYWIINLFIPPSPPPPSPTARQEISVSSSPPPPPPSRSLPLPSGRRVPGPLRPRRCAGGVPLAARPLSAPAGAAAGPGGGGGGRGRRRVTDVLLWQLSVSAQWLPAIGSVQWTGNAAHYNNTHACQQRQLRARAPSAGNAAARAAPAARLRPAAARALTPERGALPTRPAPPSAATRAQRIRETEPERQSARACGGGGAWARSAEGCSEPVSAGRTPPAGPQPTRPGPGPGALRLRARGAWERRLRRRRRRLLHGVLLHCHQLHASQQRTLSQHQGSFPRPSQQERKQNSGNCFCFSLYSSLLFKEGVWRIEVTVKFWRCRDSIWFILFICLVGVGWELGVENGRSLQDFWSMALADTSTTLQTRYTSLHYVEQHHSFPLSEANCVDRTSFKKEKNPNPKRPVTSFGLGSWRWMRMWVSLMEAGSHVTGGAEQVAGLSDGLRSLYSGCLLKDWQQTSPVRSLLSLTEWLQNPMLSTLSYHSKEVWLSVRGKHCHNRAARNHRFSLGPPGIIGSHWTTELLSRHLSGKSTTDSPRRCAEHWQCPVVPLTFPSKSLLSYKPPCTVTPAETLVSPETHNLRKKKRGGGKAR